MLRYTHQMDGEKYVKARGVELPISMKDAVVVCKTLRGKMLTDAKSLLNDVIAQKKAISYRQHIGSTGHRKGMGPGRYPVKVSKHILKVLENLEANAENKDLDTDSLKLVSVLAKKARTIKSYMYRAQGRATPFFKKRVYIEIIAKEVEENE